MSVTLCMLSRLYIHCHKSLTGWMVIFLPHSHFDNFPSIHPNCRSNTTIIIHLTCPSFQDWGKDLKSVVVITEVTSQVSSLLTSR